MRENLINKLSSKWVRVGDDVPKAQYDTIMFVGGIPEPTIPVWYEVKTKKWYKHGNIEFIPDPNSCWLRYGHSDYPNNKF